MIQRYKSQNHINSYVQKKRYTCWETLSLEDTLLSLEGGLLPPSSNKDLSCVLHRCKSENNLACALRFHAHVQKCGLEVHISIWSLLISTLVDLGSVSHAQQVFDKLGHKDAYVWNTLITGYVKHGEPQHAMALYQKLQDSTSIRPDGHTYAALLKACAQLGKLETGCKIHAGVAKEGLLRSDTFIGSTLVDMYAKCGRLDKAQEVFDALPIRTIVTLNALVTGYLEQGQCEEALICLRAIGEQGFLPDVVTYVCIFKACARIGGIGERATGQEAHADVIKKGLESGTGVANTLIDMYTKFNCLLDAQKVFDKLFFPTLVSWTALIAGYVEHGDYEEAFHRFEHMQEEGVILDAVSFVCGLKACGGMCAAGKGQQLHAELIMRGYEETELVLGSTLVDMYAKCTLLAEAQQVFDNLPVQDGVSWTALLLGYVECHDAAKGLSCFRAMEEEGVYLDVMILVHCLKACVSVGMSADGQEIHAQAARRGLESNVHIGGMLVDMYAKSGCLAEACKVFDGLSERSLGMWTSLLRGYAQRGDSQNVCDVFDRMLGEGVEPDLVTYLCVLKACNHAGLVEMCDMYFDAMIHDHNLNPMLQHYTCVVDLLCRAGHIERAISLIERMPIHPGIVLWHTVLGASLKWGNVECGREAFEHAMRLNKEDTAACVFMYNVYTDADMQDDSAHIDAIRMGRLSDMEQV